MLVIASASWTGAKADGGFWETKDGWSHQNADGLYFFIDSEAGTAVLTNSEMKSEGSTKGANSYHGDVEIPEVVTFNGKMYPVVGIQEYAFYNSTSLKAVSIPASIESIGSEAFAGCTGLENIIVDNANPSYSTINGILLSKNQKTLLYCPGGKGGECVVPNKVTAIANNAFLNCSNLTSVVLPDGVTSIGESAFDGCTSLATINIPSSLTTIGKNAFYNNRALSSRIVIPSGVLAIGVSAFQYCTSLNNVVLSEGINEIKTYAFGNCTSLQNIQLPSTITSIGDHAFANTGLTSITIPENITEIKSGTFEGAKLTYVSLPENLTAIRNKAFYNNGTTISTLNIPASVTSIGDNAFDQTTINDIYVNNTPRHLQISVSDPFNKVAGMHIHVFTQMAGIFSNSTNWSAYSGYYVDNIAIKHITAVELDQTTLSLNPNTVFQLTASILPEDADVKDLVFTTSNPNIVSVINEYTGQIKSGTADGKATITCTAADGSGYFATCVVDVSNKFVPANNITLNKQNATMNAGTNLQLSATVYPTNASYRTATWESSDVTIATVNENGLVHAIKPGNVTITAQSTDGYVSTTCDIVVSLDTYEITDDGTNYTNSEDAHVNTLTYKRKYKSDKWQCLYVPFDMSYDDWKDVIEVAIINNIHQYDDNNDGIADRTEIEVLYQRDGKTLKAHTPCMIRAKKTDSNNYQTITVSDTNLKKAEEKMLDCASVSTKFVFHGIYSKLSGSVMVENEYYSMSNGGFAKATDPNADLRGLRWYLEIIDRNSGESNLAKAGDISIIAIDEDEVTGIANIENETDNKIVSIFDANGRKMNSFQKGLNIVKYSDGTTKKIMK